MVDMNDGKYLKYTCIPSIPRYHRKWKPCDIGNMNVIQIYRVERKTCYCRRKTCIVGVVYIHIKKDKIIKYIFSIHINYAHL